MPSSCQNLWVDDEQVSREKEKKKKKKKKEKKKERKKESKNEIFRLRVREYLVLYIFILVVWGRA